MVTANPTNDCYEFVDWTAGGVKVSTNNPYTFTVMKKEILVATFARLKYKISTGSSPPNGGTTGGGGNKGCGSTATLTAHPNPGFTFVDWTVTGQPGVTIPSATCKIDVSENESFVANFKNTKVTIIAPGENEKIPAAAFPIQGTASDSSGVSAVYYNLNGTGWIEAATTDGFKTWYAWVTLKPNSANTVSAYAMNSIGYVSSTVSNKFFCTAAGLAPLSIARNQAVVDEVSNVYTSFLLSFDPAVYARVPSSTNDAGDVGLYTYTPTGPNTAELVLQSVFPTQGIDISNGVVELTFTDAYTAAYTDNSSNGGFYYFATVEDIVPETLVGSAVVATSYGNSNNISSNFFGMSTFTNEDSLGGSSSGTYTFTKFTLEGALLVETVTNPPSALGTTNYIVLAFTNGASPMSGFYSYDSVGSAQNEGSDFGTFVLNLGTDDTKYLGPVTLSGLQAIVTPKGAPSFTRTYGNGTFASISLESASEPTDVGISLANTRLSADEGSDQFIAMAPPYAVGADDGTVDLTFSSASKAALLIEGPPEMTGSITYSKLANNAPAALTGHTITLTRTGSAQTRIFTFTNNTFVLSGAESGSGTYTYAPYTPTMALAQFKFSSGAYVGDGEYILLNFVSKAGGAYVHAQLAPASPGAWTYIRGEFTFSTTK